MPDPKDGFKKVNGIPVETIVQDYLTANPPGGGAWGSITGTLSAQTDLQTALNALIPKPSSPTTGYYLKWDGTNWVAAAVAAGGVSVMQMACAHSLGSYETLYIAGPSMASSGELYAIAWVMPVAGTLSKIAVRISDAQPNQTTVVTLRKNGVDTAVTVTIPANANADVYLNTSGSVTVAAGDKISVKVYNNGSGQSATIRNVAVSLS